MFSSGIFFHRHFLTTLIVVTEQLYWRKNFCDCFRFLWLWLLISIMKGCAERCALQLYHTSLRVIGPKPAPTYPTPIPAAVLKCCNEDKIKKIGLKSDPKILAEVFSNIHSNPVQVIFDKWQLWISINCKNLTQLEIKESCDKTWSKQLNLGLLIWIFWTE